MRRNVSPAEWGDRETTAQFIDAIARELDLRLNGPPPPLPPSPQGIRHNPAPVPPAPARVRPLATRRTPIVRRVRVRLRRRRPATQAVRRARSPGRSSDDDPEPLAARGARL